VYKRLLTLLSKGYPCLAATRAIQKLYNANIEPHGLIRAASHKQHLQILGS